MQKIVIFVALLAMFTRSARTEEMHWRVFHGHKFALTVCVPIDGEYSLDKFNGDFFLIGTNDKFYLRVDQNEQSNPRFPRTTQVIYVKDGIKFAINWFKSGDANASVIIEYPIALEEKYEPILQHILNCLNPPS